MELLQGGILYVGDSYLILSVSLHLTVSYTIHSRLLSSWGLKMIVTAQEINQNDKPKTFLASKQLGFKHLRVSIFKWDQFLQCWAVINIMRWTVLCSQSKSGQKDCKLLGQAAHTHQRWVTQLRVHKRQSWPHAHRHTHTHAPSVRNKRGEAGRLLSTCAGDLGQHSLTTWALKTPQVNRVFSLCGACDRVAVNSRSVL